VLTGICLGSYGKDKDSPGSLAGLLKGLTRIEGISRIRLSSIEMADISPELLELFSGNGKLCPHFHVPLQSGDDRILAGMRRRYNRSAFLSRVKEIKKHVPGVSITTDVIVGFPGEDEEAFSNTLRTLKEIQPLRTHVFPFSPRKGTAAAQMSGHLDRETIKRRRIILSRLAQECSREYMQDFIGRESEVVPEEILSARDNKSVFLEGYSANYIRVLIPSRGILPDYKTALRVRLEGIISGGMRAEPL
jgi:threonylcarbamoyladenosine tRNA methylthiotransferase MtaB